MGSLNGAGCVNMLLKHTSASLPQLQQVFFTRSCCLGAAKMEFPMLYHKTWCLTAVASVLLKINGCWHQMSWLKHRQKTPAQNNEQLFHWSLSSPGQRLMGPGSAALDKDLVLVAAQGNWIQSVSSVEEGKWRDWFQLGAWPKHQNYWALIMVKIRPQGYRIKRAFGAVDSGCLGCLVGAGKG